MWAIQAFVGPNGGGKSLAAMELMVVRSWAAGRPVCANLALYPERLGYPADLYVPLESWKQIPELSGVTLVLDEISSVLPSRQAMSVPPQLVRVLNQLRKGDVDLGWTAPNWSRCDVLLREVTQAVTVCRGSMPDRWQRLESGPARWNRPKLTDDVDKAMRHVKGWPPNRFFSWTTYDAMEFDEFSYSTAKQIRPRRRVRYLRQRHGTDLAYNTLEAVNLLDHLDDVGLCVSCGGTRSRHKCSCGSSPRAPGRNAEGGAPGATAAEPPGMVDDRDPRGPVKPRARSGGRARP